MLPTTAQTAFTAAPAYDLDSSLRVEGGANDWNVLELAQGHVQSELSGFTSSVRLCGVGDDDECNFDDQWACSNPWILQALTALGTGGVSEYYADLFSMACVRHDGCYRHGRATYGLSRTQCDDMFYSDMLKECPRVTGLVSAVTNGLTAGVCGTFALSYYRAVQNFGDSHYHSPGTVCHYDRKNENAHVHRLHDDGRLGSVDHRYMWSSGWWIASQYPIAADKGLMLLKPGSGRTHLHKPLPTGQVGTRIADYDFSSDWTNTRSYTVGGNNYLLLLKTSSGVVHIHQMRPDGKLGTRVIDYNWSTGWTNVEFYEIGGKTYLFLLKGQSLLAPYYAMTAMNMTANGGNGTVKIYVMNPDGTVGALIKDYDWSSGWSIAKPYKVRGRHYILLLKTHNGVAHINRLNADGSIGARVATYNWSSDWTTAEPFEVNGQMYLLLMKSKNGIVKVYQLNSTGELGSLVREYDWSKGWTSATFYEVDGVPFVLLLKAVEDGTT